MNAPVTGREPREMTHAEFLAEAKARFGDDAKSIAFRCPACGDVATVAEFAAAGDSGRAGQECVGRSLGAIKTDGWTGRGCTFAAYGLIPGPWTVSFPDGKSVRSFPFAEVSS